MLLVFGIIAGPVTGLLDPDAVFGPLLFPVVSVSVAIILFEGGTSLRVAELRQVGGVVTTLVTLGALLTWSLATVAAHYVLGMPLEPALLLGALLVVTGPTVIVPLLRQMRPSRSLANALKWEGILSDPIGAVLAVLVFEVISRGGLETAWTVGALGLLETIAIGVVAAAAGAGLMIVVLSRRWVPEFLQSPLALTVVVAVFAVSNVFQSESGLLSVTLMGVAMANQKRVDVAHIVQFKENLRVILISGLFIILAARLEPAFVQAVGWSQLAFVGALILLVRPVAVGVSTLGSDFDWRERAVLAWVAPRGIVAAAVSSLFALELVEVGYAAGGQLASVTFMVIIATVVVYGFTSAPLARWLGVAQPDPQGVLIVGAHPWAREIGRELQELDIPVRLADSNRGNISQARLDGLPTYYGSTLTEGALDSIDLSGIGKLLAVTPNDEVNALTGLNFSALLGGDSVFQLAPHDFERISADATVGRRLRGSFLFREDASFWRLSARFDAGADVKTTDLSDSFDYEDFRAEHPDSIPLFVVANGTLSVVTVEGGPTPRAGQTVVALVGGSDIDEAKVREAVDGDTECE